jgi:hypothetical protein
MPDDVNQVQNSNMAKTIPKLSPAQIAALNAVATSWLDYYYRPILFPDEYFKHYKPTNRYLTMKKHILFPLYSEFTKIFLQNLANTNSFNAFEEMRKNPSKETAQKLFNEFYYFVDFAYQNNTTLQQLRNASKIPFAGQLVAILEEATSKDMRQKAGRVRVFLNNLFLNDYPNWLETLGDDNGRV